MRQVRIWGIFAFVMIFALFSQSIAFAEDGSSAEKYYFDKHYKIDKDKGFSLDEKEKIKEKDAHYGWSLGSLYVSGFTQKTEDEKGNPVFLKNSGDQVVLGFKLEQNIDKLNGDDSLSIAEDKTGYDSYFEVEKTNFGRGTLIIRHTDHQNHKKKPQVYSNYLTAKGEVNANTVVEVNEEGDYEVALDYVIKSAPRKVFGKEILPSTADYTIRLFKFSVRNGNSMVFPFDIETGEELSNKSFTDSGFRIDLAKSQYLKVFVKRDIVDSEGTEDTRENKPAKDGAEYTDGGVYTVTVEDTSTGQTTEKKIYVGSDDRYKAYVTTGLSLEEIDAQIANGASVSDDGTLINVTSDDIDSDNVIKEDNSNSSTPIVPIAVAVIVVAAVLSILVARRHRARKAHGSDSEDVD